MTSSTASAVLRTVAALALGAALVAGTGTGCSLTAKPQPSPKKRIKKGFKAPFFVVDGTEVGQQFNRFPYDMWCDFRLEATFGIFDESRAEGINANTIFGLELDSRPADGKPFYGFYAQDTQAGIVVFVNKGTLGVGQATLEGQQNYVGTKVVQVIVECIGGELVFSSRPAESNGPFDEVARLPFANQQCPLNPAFGIFNADGGGVPAEYGVRRLAVVQNGDPPAPVDAAHTATDRIVEGLILTGEARYELLKDDPDLADVDDFLIDAKVHLDLARTALESLLPGKKKSPEERSLREIRKSEKKIDKVRKRLGKKGEKGVKKATKDLANALFRQLLAADHAMPDDLRNSMPGGPQTLVK